MEKVQFVMLLMKLFVTLKPYIEEGIQKIKEVLNEFHGTDKEKQMHSILSKMQDLVSALPPQTTVLPDTKDIMQKVAAVEAGSEGGKTA